MIDKILLAPYYLTLKIRHRLYDKGRKKSFSSPVPTICFGNITVGGTGKTPHTEMLLRLILENWDFAGKRVAVLSRGYKRRSKGFKIVETSGKVSDYGDEPLQIKRKFPAVTVAVDKDRVHGCGELAYGQSKADLIVLDDAFQYRRLRPSLSIVLVDYNRPVFKDFLMPLGRLRDIPERIHKADVVIVTKCPAGISEDDKSKWIKALNFKGKVFFTKLTYEVPQAVFPEGDPRYVHSGRLILFTGIANDRPLFNHLSGKYNVLKKFQFSDHHDFTKGDIKQIENIAKHYATALIATTEKDAQRILDCKHVSQEMKRRLFKVPIRAEFTTEEEEKSFMEIITAQG